LFSDRVCSLVEIARRKRTRQRYFICLTNLAFVSPLFVEVIAEGAAPNSTNCIC
jgi:hypothetical protein